MSSVTKLIGLEMFSGPSQPDRGKPQTDLLIALRNDNYREFEYILTNYGKWIDINYLYEGPDNKTLLDIACSCKKKAQFVECLLARGVVVNSLNKLHGKAPIHLAILYSDFDTLKLLVENTGIDVNNRDKEGNTVLHYAVQLDDREKIGLLLDRGAHMGVQNSNGDLAVKFISAATLEYLLDRSIATKGQLLEKDYQIIFDYSLLMCKQSNADSVPVEETELLAAMSEVSELRPLLQHPVLTSFLDLKWQNVTSGLYWRLLFIHTALSIALTVYILLTYMPQTIILQFENCIKLANTSTKTCKNETGVTCTPQQAEIEYLDHLGALWWWFAQACISFILFRELLQLLFYSKCRYHKYFENYLKLALISVTYLVLSDKIKHHQYKYWLATVTIFLSYIELMLLISHHPVVSVSVHMFKKMIRNYTKLMTWYAAFILAFAVSFYIFFTEKNPDLYNQYTFEHVMLNITKLGFTPRNPLDGGFSVHHLAFAIYWFFVTIILFTLLNVASMNKALNTNAELLKFVSQATFIIDMEKSAPDLISLLGALNSCYQSLIERRLKRRKKERDNFSLYPSALVPPSSVDRKVCVLVNQKNRIAAKNMKFKAKEADGSSCSFSAKNWSFLKSSIEDAKKILSKRVSQEMWSSRGDKGTEDATKVVAELQYRLLALEKALKTTEEKLQNYVEDAIKRTSLQDQLKFASTMKTTEDRLQNAVEDASNRAVAEIKRFLGDILPHARTDADYFYST